MKRRLFALVLVLLLPEAAQAADKRFTLSPFDKVRIEGDVAVEIRSGAAPFAVASGDPRALESLSMRVQGGTLYIRRARTSQPTERRYRPKAPEALPLVRLDARSAVVAVTTACAERSSPAALFSTEDSGACPSHDHTVT